MLEESANPAPRQFAGVMVSSTFTDLKDLRAALIEAIEQEGLTEVAMENDPARADVDVIESSLQMVRDASAYAVVISYKYGQTPQCGRNPSGLSLTELEFNEARRLKRPILLFIMGRDYRLCPADIESDPVRTEKLNAFRARAKQSDMDPKVERVYASFSSLEEFTRKAIHAVAWLRRHLDERDTHSHPPPNADPTPERAAAAVSPSGPTPVYCNHCRKQIEVAPGSRFCIYCREPLQSTDTKVRCRRCQAENKADARYCSVCRTSLRTRLPAWAVAATGMVVVGIALLFVAVGRLPRGLTGSVKSSTPTQPIAPSHPSRILRGSVKVTASSSRDAHTPELVRDSNPSTAWVENSPVGPGPKNEWITLDFGHTVELDSVRIVNGYDSADQWQQHNRVDTLQFEFDTTGGRPRKEHLADTTGYQTVGLPQIRTSFITFRIYAVYDTTRKVNLNGTAISEIEVWGKRPH